MLKIKIFIISLILSVTYTKSANLTLCNIKQKGILDDLCSVSKKTTLFYCLYQEGFKDKAFGVLEIKEFQNENLQLLNEVKNNEVFGVFLQKQYITDFNEFVIASEVDDGNKKNEENISFSANDLFLDINPEEASRIKCKVYPNPTKGAILIDGDNIKEVDIIAMNGKVLKKIIVTKKVFDIDLRPYPKGNYLIKITAKEGVAVKKITYE